MLHEAVNGPDRDRRATTPPLVGSCAWGIVTWVDTIAKQLRCSLDLYDGGELFDFGPVTYGDLTGTGVTVGDTVLLLAVADSDEPGAALKFPQ